MVLPEHPHVGVVVHTFGLLWERLRHVGAAAKMLPYLLSPPQGPLRLVFALALIAEVVTVPAQEVASRPVQDRNPPAAPNTVDYSGANEPGALPAEVARRPLQRHRLLNVLPLCVEPAPVAEQEDQPLRSVPSFDQAPNRGRLLPRPRPGPPPARL